MGERADKQLAKTYEAWASGDTGKAVEILSKKQKEE